MTETPVRPSLARLLAPRSVAIVGASAVPDKPGWHMVNALSDFDGAVYPVNPRETEILGRKVYARLADIPETVDLVALVVPARVSVDVLREAGAAGAGAALMVSGGFGETGEAGRALQDEALAVCRENGIRLLGPNTSGFIAPARGLNCTFMPGVAEITPGGIAVLAQSGGINITLTLIAQRDGHGVRFAIGLGNAADVGLAEVIDYLADDSDTEAVALHLEGVPDGRRIYQAIRRASAIKPVVALAVGRADLGGFAVSHTGNLMGDFALTHAALTQAGAVVVEDLSELIDAAHALSHGRIAPHRDPGVGLLTGQAGPGLLMTDILRDGGAHVPDLAAATVERIEDLLPPMTFIGNPVDTGRPSATFAEVMGAMADDAAINAMALWALLEDDLVNPVRLATECRARTGKPVIVGTGSVPSLAAPAFAAAREAGVPAFDSPDRAARAMRALVRDAQAARRRALDGAPAAVDMGIASPGPDPLDEKDAKDLITAAGIATPKRVACNDRAAAHAALATLGAPVVAKVLDAAIAHKTEVGGVHLGIETPAALDAALDAIDAIPGGTRRYLIEETAPAGVEIILGGTNDPSWGPTVLLGLGGTAAEAMVDVTMRLAPLGWTEAASMLADLRGRALLEGFRGAPAVDRKAIVYAVVTLGNLLAAYPAIREIDLNPVRVTPKGLIALDALVVVQPMS